MTRCSVRGCKRRPAVIDLCRHHAIGEADRLFSRFIRARDGRCMACGSTTDLQCSHHITRARLRTRWDTANAVAHCARCHMRFTAHPAAHLAWILDHVSPEIFRVLVEAAYGPVGEDGLRHAPRVTSAEIQERLLWLRGLVAEMEEMEIGEAQR